MPDISSIIQAGIHNPWAYLPLAVLLGALHALEPGHSKSMMVAFVVATRGTPGQAALLGGAAAIGHTLVVWLLAAIGLFLGDKLILDRAEPWLVLVSGLLITGLAFRIVWLFRREQHHHGHEHDHSSRVHNHGHDEAHAHEIAHSFEGRKVSNLDIAWFGLTGGLLPCPSALAVLLVCIQIKAFTLGFSIGLAITLMSVGVLAAWGARKASEGWAGYSAVSGKLPYVSAAIVMLAGAAITGRGLMQLGVF